MRFKKIKCQVLLYNKMVKISSARNFQYKIVKSILLSILIPTAIILFSAWFFFGDMWGKSGTPNKTDACKGMTKDKCKLDACVWDPKQNMCLGAK
jgi:hypothetical protein